MIQDKIYNKSNIKYLRVILTNRCNLNCEGCHKEGQLCHAEINDQDLIAIIAACIHVGIKKVKLMGGEPTLRNNLINIIKNIKK